MQQENALCEKIALSFDEYKSASNENKDLIKLLNEDLSPNNTELLDEKEDNITQGQS